MLGTVHSKNQ